MLKWFNINSLKANPSKFQCMALGLNNTASLSSNVNGINYYSMLQ